MSDISPVYERMLARRARTPAGLRYLSDNSVGSETDRYNMWRQARERGDARRRIDTRSQEERDRYNSEQANNDYRGIDLGEGRAYMQGRGGFNNDYSQTFGDGGSEIDIEKTIDVDNTTSSELGNDNTFGVAANIGNNYSITFANQGNNNPYESLQLAVKANALNDNFSERSKSMISGIGRAAMGTKQGEEYTGSRDIVENLYNEVGAAQKYYTDSAKQYRARAFGDTNQTPTWKAPKPPKFDDDDD